MYNLNSKQLNMLGLYHFDNINGHLNDAIKIINCVQVLIAPFHVIFTLEIKLKIDKVHRGKKHLSQ